MTLVKKINLSILAFILAFTLCVVPTPKDKAHAVVQVIPVVAVACIVGATGCLVATSVADDISTTNLLSNETKQKLRLAYDVASFTGTLALPRLASMFLPSEIAEFMNFLDVTYGNPGGAASATFSVSRWGVDMPVSFYINENPSYPIPSSSSLYNTYTTYCGECEYGSVYANLMGHDNYENEQWSLIMTSGDNINNWYAARNQWQIKYAIRNEGIYFYTYDITNLQNYPLFQTNVNEGTVTNFWYSLSPWFANKLSDAIVYEGSTVPFVADVPSDISSAIELGRETGAYDALIEAWQTMQGSIVTSPANSGDIDNYDDVYVPPADPALPSAEVVGSAAWLSALLAALAAGDITLEEVIEAINSAVQTGALEMDAAQEAIQKAKDIELKRSRPYTPGQLNPITTSLAGLTEFLKTKFPFCLPFDLYLLCGIFVAQPVAPHWTWDIEFPWGDTIQLDIDLSPFDDVATVLRLLLFVFAIMAGIKISKDLFDVSGTGEKH